jgi:putative ABC transport system permease protein
MFKNYFKIAWRNLWKNKIYSAINIVGLAIGMAACTVIMLFVLNEKSFDNFQTNNIYRLNEVQKSEGVSQKVALSMFPMGPTMQKEFPEIKNFTRINWAEKLEMVNGDKRIFLPVTYIVDSTFLQLFNFKLLEGNKKTVLQNPNSIVLTQSSAEKLFGKENPIGKTIINYGDDTTNFIVTGVLENVPQNSQLQFDALYSFSTIYSKNPDMMNSWGGNWLDTYFELGPNTNVAALENKFPAYLKKYMAKNDGWKNLELFLLPFKQVHAHAADIVLDYLNYQKFDSKYTNIFFATALVVLLIACINFMNLSTASSEKRAKEVGVRKVVGAGKKSLIWQFLAESFFITFISGLLAIIIVQLCLPAFNQLVQKQLFINYTSIYSWIAAIGFILFTAMLAGSYPAFFLSAFRPIAVLKGTFKKLNTSVTPRKVLVVLQFTFAIALIISSLIIEQQIKYAQQRETGYNKKNLGYVFIQGDIHKNYELIKNALLSSGVATSVSKTQAPLTQNWSSADGMKWQGKDPNSKILINCYTEDGDLVKTAGMQLVKGRDIDIKNFPSDSTACLISESAVKVMGFKNPIGQNILDKPVNWHVVGVIKDFILESPYEPIKPFMVKGPKYEGNVVYIRFNSARTIAQNIEETEKIFKQYNPASPFEFHFADKEYAQKFSDELLTETLASLFASLIIFISCLGLFGLTTYMAANRRKEIGIRKVLGASITSITLLLSQDFIKLVAIACLVAFPIAWWIMHDWLQNYEYRITISWWAFLVAGITAIIIALITISFQSIKTAIANPVKSLRTE